MRHPSFAASSARFRALTIASIGVLLGTAAVARALKEPASSPR